MNRNLILLALLILLSQVTIAQKITITLPNEANKEYVFLLNQGIEQDTIRQGTFNFLGNTVITIPEKYNAYQGVGILKIKNGASVSLVINNEDFSVDAAVASNQYVFKNSKENEYLYSMLHNQQGARDATLYADKFLQLYGFMHNLSQLAQGQIDLTQKAQMRLYALNELDVDALYTSGLWYYIIDGVLKFTPDQAEMGKNMVRMLKRVKSQTVFEAFANNLITITEQYGWDDAFDVIIPYVQESGRIEAPQGQMYTAFALAKVRKGMTAPAIVGLPKSTVDYTKILLVFYQPSCHNCEEQLDILKKEYDKIDKEGLRIVSISSDYDVANFEKDKTRFPWADKLCDFKGFAGANYANYGILGTPTFFLLDSKMTVLGRYAKFSDISF